MEELKLTLFYGGPFSQWFACRFVLDDIQYNCAEQYMMAQKAMIFGDEEAYTAIMESKSPSKQKELGKGVKRFTVEEWNKHAKLIVYRGNLAKFSQTLGLYTILMATKGSTLVEASPTDKIWGIGLGEHDPRAKQPDQWQGLNWLGECITAVREDLELLKVSVL